ncbi:MAG: NTP transferase domain-containing protein [Syntrophomonadaceae bacterium]|nr:NTP transferase domain-containing protein [Syntrophomonadaceae bacterium]
MIAIILAGGKGLRLWPESRKNHPKQLCKFVNNQSMLEHTIERLHLAGSKRIAIITSDDLLPLVENLVYQSFGTDNIDIISEPEGKNTAPAVGLALSLYYEQFPNEVIGVFPADHHVLDVNAFIASIDKAAQAAEKGHLTTIGISPNRPETGYGYIEKTRYEVGEIPDVYHVNSFYEKPDYRTAANYISTGNHMWNSGIYISKTKTLLDEFKKYLPELYEKIILGHTSYLNSYPNFPSISLDYAIAEKSQNIAVVPADFGWCDLGSWNALEELYPLDDSNNICNGQDIVPIESYNCVIKQADKSIVTFGLDNLLVVETDDVIFVADRNRCQDFRHIVEILEKQNRHDLI